MLDATPYLRAFVEKLTEMNRGRAFFTTPETLGDYVLVDFIEQKRAPCAPIATAVRHRRRSPVFRAFPLRWARERDKDHTCVITGVARRARPGAAPNRPSCTVPPRGGHVQIPISIEEPDDQSWQDYANCLGVDPDLFFPERGASTREAKEVCRGCVVREDCLEYALVNGEKFGIWGGMSERERRRLRRQRALARRASSA